MSRQGSPNRLIDETSPYLQQHAHNPVDWYAWGDEALERARAEDKPIFLSIGYAACHWCHVMERESFEDETIAAFMNEHFVNIKVDREERPDLDEIYMAAVQMMTGSGGWPMSVFLTPDLKPFFGGTYFPPDDHLGRPGFRRLLQALLTAYRTRREEVEAGAEQATERIKGLARIPGGSALLSTSILKEGAESLLRSFDPVYGGFGGAPKFPHTMGIQLLLRLYARTGDLGPLRASAATLDRMAEGGIYDHLGGGFHRYSTDERWLVPHFEKMLYDQALLVLAYVEGFQVAGSPLYARVVRETVEYVLRDLTSPEGGFYSTEDADSEGEEGKFYVWTPAEIEPVLGKADAEVFNRAYDVEEGGNFEGRSILHPIRSSRDLALLTSTSAEEVEEILARGRAQLLAARGRRIRPLRDEKILASWNGLMIGAMARAGSVLDETAYTKAATRAAEFVLDRMRVEGQLFRVYREGRLRHPAYLDDYANLIAGLVDLYEASFEIRWLQEAERLSETMIAEFADAKDGGFFLTSTRHQGILARLKLAQDGSVPSGNSQAALACLRLGRLLGRPELEKQGESTLRAFQNYLERAPGAFHHMLVALDLYLGQRQELVVVGPLLDGGTRSLLAVLRRKFLPCAVVSWTDGKSPHSLPLHQGKVLVEGRAAAYVCQDSVCERPVTTPQDLETALLEKIAS